MRFALNDHSQEIIVTRTSGGEEVVSIPEGTVVTASVIAKIDGIVGNASKRWHPRPPTTYTYSQAATILGRSEKWLQRRKANGRIPYSTDGHRVWWTRDQLRQISTSLTREAGESGEA